VRCTLRESLAFTGKGHATDRAVTLGMYRHTPQALAKVDVNTLFQELWQQSSFRTDNDRLIHFNPAEDIIFDRGDPLPEHPNGMIFQLLDGTGKTLLSETYFSIGGGFISTIAEIGQIVAP
jgi:L-serine dehydratase